ncbi:MAG: metalloprotease TldD, partial [Alphaproteobacteria bacterium]
MIPLSYDAHSAFSGKDLAPVTDAAPPIDLFFARTGMDPVRAAAQVRDALAGMDDGELYLEYAQSESFAWDDGRLKTASFDTSQGFGLRAVYGEATGYAHATELSHAAIARAAAAVQAVKTGQSGHLAAGPPRTNRHLYGADNPLESQAFAEKVKLLQAIDAYARARDPKVAQVSATLSGEWQAVEIIRADGQRLRDVRPLVRLNVQIVAANGQRREVGYHGMGGRRPYGGFFD